MFDCGFIEYLGTIVNSHGIKLVRLSNGQIWRITRRGDARRDRGAERPTPTPGTPQGAYDYACGYHD